MEQCKTFGTETECLLLENDDGEPRCVFERLDEYELCDLATGDHFHGAHVDAQTKLSEAITTTLVDLHGDCLALHRVRAFGAALSDCEKDM